MDVAMVRCFSRFFCQNADRELTKLNWTASEEKFVNVVAAAAAAAGRSDDPRSVGGRRHGADRIFPGEAGDAADQVRETGEQRAAVWLAGDRIPGAASDRTRTEPAAAALWSLQWRHAHHPRLLRYPMAWRRYWEYQQRTEWISNQVLCYVYSYIYTALWHTKRQKQAQTKQVFYGRFVLPMYVLHKNK